MKYKILNIFFSTLTCFVINAQTTERVVVASAGGSAIVNGEYIDWTIGEPVIETINNDAIIVSQGFHQLTGSVSALFKINGNILGNGIPYSNADVFLYLAKSDISAPALYKGTVKDGAFNFSFIPKDKYLIYALPFSSDEFLPTYYVRTTDRNKAFIMETDANIGGLDLQLVSKQNAIDDIALEQNSDFHIFPNPVYDNLSVIANFKSQNMFQLKIIDLTGNILFVSEMNSNELLTLDLTPLPVGLYIINIDGELGTYYKIIAKVKSYIRK